MTDALSRSSVRALLWMSTLARTLKIINRLNFRSDKQKQNFLEVAEALAKKVATINWTYILKVSIKKTCELMRKREQRKQQDRLANFGDRTPVSGHDRMTNVDVPRGKRDSS